MLKNVKNGISLIVLVITIVVIIILTGAVIMTLSQNNPITMASKAAFLSDIKNFQSELDLYNSKEYTDKIGAYDPNLLKADENSVTYNGAIDTNKNIKNVITSLNSKTEYDKQFEILNGKLIYKGDDVTRQNWARESSVTVITGATEVRIFAPNKTVVSQGTDVTYSVELSSNVGISGINLVGNVELVGENNLAISNQPQIVVGTASGTNSDFIRTVAITIKTDTLENGVYKLKIKSGSVSNELGVSNRNDSISNIAFDVDNTAPENPSMSASPLGWTNGDVTITVTYPSDANQKQYSLDGTNWLTYDTPVTISENNITIYARAIDIAGNQSGQSTLTVSNIDRISPIVSFGTNGATGVQTATTTVTVNDDGGSLVDISTLQYVWDTQNTTSPTSGWAIFSNGQTITKGSIDGTYYLWIKANDNAGNTVISKTNAFYIDNTPPENPLMSASPTGWTNSDVLVTVVYPSDANLKQYSYDTATWNNYTAPIVVTANNITIYARALDAAGNQSGASSITVSNIDKTPPTVTIINNGVTTSSISVMATASDAGGSGLNTNSYQYSKDNGTTWTAATNSTTYSFTGLTSGTYQCRVKVTDIAGNSTVSTAVPISTQGIGSITLNQTPTAWTNGSVTVTISYPSGLTTKEYKIGSGSWATYSGSITLSTNDTVTARGSDVAGNQATQASIVVSNIDKTAPTVSFATNGSSYTEIGYTPLTVSDVGGSGINASTLQYVWDTQNSTTPSSGWTAFTNGSAVYKDGVYGTYYLWVKANDNAGNSIVTKSNAFFISSYETYENGTMFSYYNVSNWYLTGEVAYDGDWSYWTNFLSEGSSATTSFNINVPNDGRNYYLGLNSLIHNISVNDGGLNVIVNGVYTHISDYPDNVWNYNEVALKPGNNVITFDFRVVSQDMGAMGMAALDDLNVFYQ